MPSGATVAAGKVLVTADYPGGSAGVVIRRRAYWLTDELDRDGPATMLDDYSTAVMGLAGGGRLEGGLLPPGASTATVTDDAGVRRPAAVGNGAWAAVFAEPYDRHLSPVCFHGADETIVAPPLPADWARSPVVDADEACPACDSVQRNGTPGQAAAPRWDQVVPTDESRGSSGPDMRPTPFVVCRTCGHEHSVGAWFSVGDDHHEHDPEMQARLIADGQARMAEEIRGPLRTSTLPVYAVPGWTRRLGGWGMGGWEHAEGELTSITVDHGGAGERAGPKLDVQTSHERDEYGSDAARARSMLATGALREGYGDAPNRSTAGLAIWMYIQDRELLRLAAVAPVEQRDIPVDGQPRRFAVVRSGAHWTAVSSQGLYRIALSGHDVDLETIELAALEDPVRDLLSG